MVEEEFTFDIRRSQFTIHPKFRSWGCLHVKFFAFTNEYSVTCCEIWDIR